MPNYRCLIAWKKGFSVAQKIYQLTSTLPQNQRYSLCDQMERSAISIISNLAEGSRRTQKEWEHYLRIALGSASELETQILLVKTVYTAPVQECDEILGELDQISRLLNAYISRK